MDKGSGDWGGCQEWEKERLWWTNELMDILKETTNEIKMRRDDTK
jgi:hypothetical protein